MPRSHDADADLILKLYDARREAEMRKARQWWTGTFWPTTVDDVLQVMRASGRKMPGTVQVLGYWNMAAILRSARSVERRPFPRIVFQRRNVFSSTRSSSQFSRNFVRKPRIPCSSPISRKLNYQVEDGPGAPCADAEERGKTAVKRWPRLPQPRRAKRHSPPRRCTPGCTRPGCARGLWRSPSKSLCRPAKSERPAELLCGRRGGTSRIWFACTSK